MGIMYGFEKMYQLASLCSSGTNYHLDIEMMEISQGFLQICLCLTTNYYFAL